MKRQARKEVDADETTYGNKRQRNIGSEPGRIHITSRVDTRTDSLVSTTTLPTTSQTKTISQYQALGNSKVSAYRLANAIYPSFTQTGYNTFQTRFCAVLNLELWHQGEELPSVTSSYWILRRPHKAIRCSKRFFSPQQEMSIELLETPQESVGRWYVTP